MIKDLSEFECYSKRYTLGIFKKLLEEHDKYLKTGKLPSCGTLDMIRLKPFTPKNNNNNNNKPINSSQNCDHRMENKRHLYFN